MSRRLLLGYVGLTVFVLAVLVIPLGVSNARNERQNLTTKVERDAVALATLAEDTLEGRSNDTAALERVAARYQDETGGRVVIVDAEGDALVDSAGPGGASRSFASRPEIAQALSGEVATGTRPSVTLGTDLLYVAVPVASSGVVHGAVRVTYPLSTVDQRVLRYWLILAAISAVVLAVASIVGLRLARSIARPLADVEQAAARAGAGDLTARAPEDEGPPEVRSLAGSFNHMVGTVDELVRSREAFVADASHQLRTPLQALRLRLENLERDVSPDARGDLDAALAEMARLSHLVDGLLALARTDSTTAQRRELRLDDVVARAGRRLGGARGRAGRRAASRRPRRHAGARHPGAPRAGARQPARERARGLASGIGDRGLGSVVDRLGRDARRRRGPGHDRRAAPAGVRPLLARRRLARRLRPRACDRRAPRQRGRGQRRAPGRVRRRARCGRAPSHGGGPRRALGYGIAVT